MPNELYRKVISSPKFAKILKRQKIHSETTAHIREHKILHNGKMGIIHSNNTISNNFSTYIDRHYINSQCLSGFSVDSNVFIHNDQNMLLSNINIQSQECYVPFHCRKSNKLFPGVLLDLPEIVALEKCSDGFPTYTNSSPEERLNIQDKGNVSILGTSLIHNTLNSEICDINEIIPYTDNVATDDIEIRNVEEFSIHSEVSHRQELILDPLRLNTITRGEEQRLKLSEHNQLVRIIIMYTLAFFALALITFFIIYLA